MVSGDGGDLTPISCSWRGYLDDSYYQYTSCSTPDAFAERQQFLIQIRSFQYT